MEYKHQTFDKSIKKSFQNLLTQCWSRNPNERPTFEEIYFKLAYNFDDYIVNEEDERINWLKTVDIPNLVCMVVTIIAFIAANYVPVKQLYVPENDSLSSFPYPGKEKISTIVCAVIVIIIGIVMIVVFFLLSKSVYEKPRNRIIVGC